MKQSNLISLTIIPWTSCINYVINIKENSTINDLIQIIKKILEKDGLQWGDGRDGWHLFYGKNLNNHLLLLDKYNIKEGARINILPGNRARDLVPKREFDVPDMRRAKQLSIRSEHLRRRQIETSV